jgi:nucleoside-diphosphate-sugar epimerase
MNILVTGNMGYVGPLVVRQLRSSYPNAALVGLDTGFFAHCLTGADHLPECRTDIQLFMDVRKVDSRHLEGIDAIVHLAAISNDPMGKKFEDVTYEINHKASVDLAKKAKHAGVKSFVYASSCSIYGFAEGESRNEHSPLNPLTAYAKSKVLAEEEIGPLAGQDFIVTSLRFSTACGMSERLRLDLVLNDFVAGAVASGAITILSDGTPWRPLINVADMARAIDWAICRESFNGGDFLAVNVGCDGWNYQVRELAEVVGEVLPGTSISINKDAQPDKRSYKVDFGLFRRLAPEHQPQVSLRETIGGIKEGLEAMNFRDPNFRNSRFMRLKALSELQESGLVTDRLEWVGKITEHKGV